MNVEALKPVLYWSGLFVFLLLEIRRPYRQPSVSKLKRWQTNLPLSIINGLTYHFVYSAIIIGLLFQTEKMNSGLFNTLSLPDWLQIILGILVLDLVIYIWHLLNHVVPLFWRFHRIHHSDINLDVSTANRFHLGELLLSGLVRIATIYTFGISLSIYILFEILVNLSIQFHHSSIKISTLFEKYWLLLFVSPSMHRIHHSVKIKERDSNYGVLLSLWDRIFGTLIWGANQQSIIIGIGSHREFSKLNFLHVWLMPFTQKSL